MSGFDPSRVRFESFRELLSGVAFRFRKQYAHALDTVAFWSPDRTKRQIADELDALDPNSATSTDVDTIIGTGGWVTKRCDFCGTDMDEWFQLGDEPDYEARYLEVCGPCVAALPAIAMEARKGRDREDGLDGEAATARAEGIARKPVP